MHCDVDNGGSVGWLVFYEDADEDCDACQAGTCIRRVFRDLEGVVILHGTWNA